MQRLRIRGIPLGSKTSKYLYQWSYLLLLFVLASLLVGERMPGGKLPLTQLLWSASGALQTGQADCNPYPQTIKPRQLAHAYGYDNLWQNGLHGEGITVYLVEIDAVRLTDLSNYFACIGYPGNNLQIVTVDAAPQAVAGETTLDIEMISSLARNVHIVDYQTNGDTQGNVWIHVNDTLKQIIASTANALPGTSIVSISLGTPEQQIGAPNRTLISSSLQTLSQEHVPVFIASGDEPIVNYPASDPNAIAVGGTVLNVDAGGNRQTEQAWSRSGGGASQVFPRPAYQQAVQGNTQGMRLTPDVAAVADGLAFYFNGQWSTVGGTSASAPIWAAGIALVNEGLTRQGLGGITSPQDFYTLATPNAGNPTPYFDITQGSRATVGWDEATGLGSPNLAALLEEAQTKGL